MPAIAIANDWHFEFLHVELFLKQLCKLTR